MKKYIILISENLEADWNYNAMFKGEDKFYIDLREKSHKTLEKHYGTFNYDKSIKGWRNGGEIGIFTSENNEKFVVFSDYSVAKYN